MFARYRSAGSLSPRPSSLLDTINKPIDWRHHGRHVHMHNWLRIVRLLVE